MPAIQYVNPESLHKNPAFTQAITIDGPHRVIYVGGQNAVSPTGEIVGAGDVAAQTTKAMTNMLTVLEATGATFENVVKFTVYIVHGQSLPAAFGAAQQVMGRSAHPPTVTVLQVAGLAHPEFLVELEAVAVVAEKEG